MGNSSGKSTRILNDGVAAFYLFIISKYEYERKQYCLFFIIKKHGNSFVRIKWYLSILVCEVIAVLVEIYLMGTTITVIISQ